VEKEGRGLRFNSGKWLQISRDFVEIRTGSEQMTLPAWSIHEGKGNLEVRFRWGKGHPSISTGTKDEREAHNRAPDLVKAWIKSKGKSRAAHPLEASCEEFLGEQYADRKKDTRAEVDLILRRLAGVFPGISEVREISPKVFRAKAATLRGEAAPGYWTNILVTVRKFFRWAVSRGYMNEDPTEGIPAPGKGRGKRRDVWADEYFEEVLGAVSEGDREILMVMRWSGIDSGDLHTFDPRKHLVKDDSGALTFRKLREKAKSDEETIIQPVSSKILPYMEARKKSGEGYGAGYASVRSFTASLRKRVQASMLRAGLPVRDLKSLRHTFATHHAERGVPLDVLRRWLGHSRDSRTLDRYYLHRASTARFMD
jgi:integrase